VTAELVIHGETVDAIDIFAFAHTATPAYPDRSRRRLQPMSSDPRKASSSRQYRCHALIAVLTEIVNSSCYPHRQLRMRERKPNHAPLDKQRRRDRALGGVRVPISTFERIRARDITSIRCRGSVGHC